MFGLPCLPVPAFPLSQGQRQINQKVHFKAGRSLWAEELTTNDAALNLISRMHMVERPDSQLFSDLHIHTYHFFFKACFRKNRRFRVSQEQSPTVSYMEEKLGLTSRLSTLDRLMRPSTGFSGCSSLLPHLPHHRGASSPVSPSQEAVFIKNRRFQTTHVGISQGKKALKAQQQLALSLPAAMQWAPIPALILVRMRD